MNKRFIFWGAGMAAVFWILSTIGVMWDATNPEFGPNVWGDLPGILFVCLSQAIYYTALIVIFDIEPKQKFLNNYLHDGGK
jgi:hypothetical protein